MSELYATPGPWVLEDRGSKFIVHKPAEGYITRDICRMDSSTMSAFAQKANAHLIAAAPELYEALKELMEVELKHSGRPIHSHTQSKSGTFEWMIETKKAYEKARAALAKARGEG